ncbi:unnamed protein product [Dicrocoelium dendriticum]|nr:unnamed protein product [Dicrocoelium dendriticum]
MPEYLQKRFGGIRLQIYLACMALFLYIFTKISADLYAGGVFIDQAIQINLYPAIIVLLLISGLFTILGGLTAVIWTDFIQTILMVVGAFYLMIAAFVKVGGFDAMVEGYFNAVPNTTLAYRDNAFNYTSTNSAVSHFPKGTDSKYSECGIPPADAMHMFRNVEDPEYPWTGVIFGLTISNIWYWCTDQVIVQRTLSAKNLTHAKSGCILAGFLKLLPLWLLIFPGMISRILFPDEIACGDPALCERICGKSGGCTDIAYPRLVLRLLPPGAKGLMIAVMIASLVSSLTSIFNSSSTLFTMDIWRRIRPRAGSAELMIVGRVTIVVLIGISVAWIPIVQSSGELFHYIQSVTSYLAPPVCAVYLLAMFWARFNELGAFVALMVGLVIGLIRFIWEAIYPVPNCGEEQEITTAQLLIVKLNYLHFGVILFVITLVVAWAAAILSEPPPHKRVDGLTFGTLRHEQPQLPGEETDTTETTEGHGDMLAAAEVYTDIDQDDKESERSLKHRPWYLVAVYWVCGIESTQSSQSTVVEELNLSIEEKPKYRLGNEIAALVLLAAVTFVWGFFA